MTYTGHVDRPALQRLYADSDVLILPSLYEVWGLVINEALEHGLPVIATQAVGSVDDLVRHDVNGYVTRTGDVGELREAMTRIAGWDDVVGALPPPPMLRSSSAGRSTRRRRRSSTRAVPP